MRSNALLFVHLLGAFALLGGVLVVTTASLAALRREAAREVVMLAQLAHRALVFVVWPSLIVVVGAGEGLAAKEDAEGAWLDVASGLTYAGGVVGAALLTFLTRLAWRHAERSAGVGGLLGIRAVALVGVSLATVLGVVVFLMTAKPGA